MNLLRWFDVFLEVGTIWRCKFKQFRLTLLDGSRAFISELTAVFTGFASREFWWIKESDRQIQLLGSIVQTVIGDSSDRFSDEKQWESK
jgi:hypothetical protein